LAARALCSDCGRPPTNRFGEIDEAREYCWSCEDYEDSRPGEAPSGHMAPSYQSRDPRKRKRILALPSTHPDAYPQSNLDAHRIMAKHDICPETGAWKSETKKAAAMNEAKKRDKKP